MKAALVVAALLASLSACAASDTGVVTGGIEPCAAIGYPGEPHYAAGTVTVLTGQRRERSIGPGSWVEVLPTTVVAHEQVGVNAIFSFVLKPGDYVVEAHFPPPATVVPWIKVTVYAGQTLHADITNECK